MKNEATMVPPELSKLRLLQDKVLVRRDAPEEKTSGGIFIPSAAVAKRVMFATVLAVGPGRRRQRKIRRMNGIGKEIVVHRDVGSENAPVEVKPGDRIIVSVWAGFDPIPGDNRHTILDSVNLIEAVLEEDIPGTLTGPPGIDQATP